MDGNKPRDARFFDSQNHAGERKKGFIQGVMDWISAIICTKKKGNFPVDLDRFLSVGYNRNVEDCPLRGTVPKRRPMDGTHEIW